VRKSPAVTEIDEHLELAYPVEDLGTEEFLYDGPSSAGYMEICYGIDVALILANLHPDFINAASMYAFLTELLTQTGIEVDMYDDGDEYAFDVSAGERLLPECTASDAGKTVKVNSSGTGYVLV